MLIKPINMINSANETYVLIETIQQHFVARPMTYLLSSTVSGISLWDNKPYIYDDVRCRACNFAEYKVKLAEFIARFIDQGYEIVHY